ncbi:hypothetical protein [Dongia sp. agr-C8]
MIGSARDDKQFRRGVVLGLTMAEALLLLIFLLMLILGIRLKTQTTQLAELEKQRDDAQSTLVAMQPVFDKLSKTEKFDITKDYVRMQQQLADANARLKDAELSVDLMQRAASLAPAEATPEQAVRALLNEAAVGRQALDAAQRLVPDLPPEKAVEALVNAAIVGQSLKDGGTPDALLASAGACKADLQSCKNQTTYLNSKLNAKTGGFDLPPCWVDNKGKIQYIFDASLTDAGIYIEDKAVSGREGDQEKLPLSRARYGEPLGPGEFSAAFSPLLKWSNDHGCRFYVRLYDDMRDGDRAEYKELRGTVEGYFRILLSY